MKPSGNIVNLLEMKTGQSGRIMEVRAGMGLARRLETMGMRVGIQCVKISGMPLGGPVVVQLGGTRIALGRGMARKVMVEVRPS